MDVWRVPCWARLATAAARNRAQALVPRSRREVRFAEALLAALYERLASSQTRPSDALAVRTQLHAPAVGRAQARAPRHDADFPSRVRRSHVTRSLALVANIDAVRARAR
jgi:hypothetical protein